MEQIKNTSKVLGILSICIGCIMPIPGIILGIIGLSVKKAKPDRDVYLNVIGIVASIFMWLLWYNIYMIMLL